MKKNTSKVKVITTEGILNKQRRVNSKYFKIMNKQMSIEANNFKIQLAKQQSLSSS
ncbi:hypothetical protein [Flavobacterium sp.]|uniref:hypothetical protein n=1 Tax=Flavobacterium sp. TaxID=239 RepID=UPI00375354B9